MGLVWRISARAFTRFQKIVQCECSLRYLCLKLPFHFISFHFIKEGSPSTGLQPELFYKGPSTKNIKIQLHNEKENLEYKNPIIKAKIQYLQNLT